MSKVQSILFDKNYWNIRNIVDFLYDHDFEPIKGMHITNNYYRVRIKHPLKNKSYRTKNISEGLKFIIEFP